MLDLCLLIVVGVCVSAGWWCHGRYGLLRAWLIDLKQRWRRR